MTRFAQLLIVQPEKSPMPWLLGQSVEDRWTGHREGTASGSSQPAARLV
jgi:hypothetical protein